MFSDSKGLCLLQAETSKKAQGAAIFRVEVSGFLIAMMFGARWGQPRWAQYVGTSKMHGGIWMNMDYLGLLYVIMAY